jgi:hypothetical protein
VRWNLRAVDRRAANEVISRFYEKIQRDTWSGRLDRQAGADRRATRAI